MGVELLQRKRGAAHQALEAGFVEQVVASSLSGKGESGRARSATSWRLLRL